jgi:hypothetical protein
MDLRFADEAINPSPLAFSTDGTAGILEKGRDPAPVLFFPSLFFFL